MKWPSRTIQSASSPCSASGRGTSRLPQREEYSSTHKHMRTLASAIPGFISFRRYTSEDGETLAVTEFASAEALAAWRDHPDHGTAQQRGRHEFYSEYEIIKCTVIHRYGYKH